MLEQLKDLEDMLLSNSIILSIGSERIEVSLEYGDDFGNEGGTKFSLIEEEDS